LLSGKLKYYYKLGWARFAVLYSPHYPLALQPAMSPYLLNLRGKKSFIEFSQEDYFSLCQKSKQINKKSKKKKKFFSKKKKNLLSVPPFLMPVKR
jgi:hypothetical protein